MTVADKYQFFLEFPSAGSREAFPVNSSLQWQWRKPDGKRYFRRDLTTRLIFQNQHRDNITDFDPWYLTERSKQRCDKINLTMWRNCDGSSTEDFKGQTTILDAAFDAGICSVDVKFQPNDPYACIYNNYEKERNVFDYTSPVTAQIFVGDIQISGKVFQQLPGSALDSLQRANFPYSLVLVGNDGTTIDLNEGWTPYRTFFYWISNNNPNDPDDGVWQMEMQYIREFSGSTTEPPGFGWVAVAGGYARRIQTKITREIIAYGSVIIEYEPLITANLGIDNGRYLNDIIEYFLTSFCPEYQIVSNFFGINPDGTNPNNVPYTKALAFMQELMVFAKGDVIRPNADENNRILNLTWKQLLENLEVVFNIEQRIVDDKIYIEHYSYFQTDLMLDLTVEKYLPCLVDKWAWTYNKESIPPRELFEWEEKTDEGSPNYDFDSRHINYADECIIPEGNNEVIKRANNVMTNIAALIADDNLENWSITKSSFVLVSTEGGYINQSPGKISGDVLLNGALAWSNLLEDYHKYGRPLNRGIINGQVMDFTSTRKIRKQVPIEIPLCCADLPNFIPDRMLVKTQLGFGCIDSATLDEPNGILTLELVFD